MGTPQWGVMSHLMKDWGEHATTGLVGCLWSPQSGLEGLLHNRKLARRHDSSTKWYLYDLLSRGHPYQVYISPIVRGGLSRHFLHTQALTIFKWRTTYWLKHQKCLSPPRSLHFFIYSCRCMLGPRGIVWIVKHDINTSKMQESILFVNPLSLKSQWCRAHALSIPWCKSSQRSWIAIN